eukprot:373730_1
MAQQQRAKGRRRSINLASQFDQFQKETLANFLFEYTESSDISVDDLNSAVSDGDIYSMLSDGLILLKILDKLVPSSVNWKKVENNPNNKFKKLNNTNYVVILCKQSPFKFSVVGVGGSDIVDGNRPLINVILTQMKDYAQENRIAGVKNPREESKKDEDDSSTDSDVPPQEPVDPQKELALIVIDYEAEFQFETDHKQQDTTVVSDRVFSKQKQEIIDRYIASKIARINKNESLIDILSDYAFHTLNDPILNHFEQQIMAFFATK